MRKLTGFEVAQIARECDTDIETIRRVEAKLEANLPEHSSPEEAFRARLAAGLRMPRIDFETNKVVDAAHGASD